RRRPARHEAGRDRRAHRAGARPRRRHGLYLRLLARIRQHQRRLPFLNPRPRTTAVTSSDFSVLIERAERVLAQLEAWLPAAPPEIDWSAHAYRWRKRGGARGWLDAVRHVARIDLADLQHIERQKGIIDRNTRQFLQKKPANNVLMTGARGTGKSSLVKAMLAAYGDQGLRLIEVDKSDLGDLPDIVELVAARPERYIVFCDDLSFEEGEAGYKALKSVLDGSVSAAGDNVLIYATSNRRHLMPEYMSENLQARHQPDG